MSSAPQLGAMISTEPVLEACGGVIPAQGDLKTLLLHQQAKGLLGVKGTQSFVCVNETQVVNKSFM